MRNRLEFPALAALHGALLLSAPSIPVIAIGLWWNANTIAHNFIHRPFFRLRALNVLTSAYLTLLLGAPQSLWRERHLAHHTNTQWRFHPSIQAIAESALVLLLWITLALTHSHFFIATYLPAYLIGMTLCSMQGHYEHSRSAISHYGPIYNFLFFNDGYHAEHHARPGVAWHRLPEQLLPNANASRWPACLRFLDALSLEALERLTLRAPILQRWVLRNHRRAIESLLPVLPAPKQISIVGGGLFPRTALIVNALMPDAAITLVDQSSDHLDIAQTFLYSACRSQCRRFNATEHIDTDLLIIPLAFQGDRARIYRNPPSRAVIVHDWIWRPRGHTRIVSWLLLKRVNLVLQ